MRREACGQLGLQGLLRELVGQLREGEAARREALQAYAAELASQNRAEDSALAYLAAGDREAALDCYHSSGQWQMALALAGASHAAPFPFHFCHIVAEHVRVRLRTCLN